MKIQVQFIKMAFILLLLCVILSISFFPSQIVNAATNVTIKLYIYDSDNQTGKVLSGVLVTGTDGIGASFSQTTNPSGYVTITGAAGTWFFTVSKSGYQKNTPWMNSITSPNTLQCFLFPSFQAPCLNQTPSPNDTTIW
ncbi:MAG: hypothetical protein ABSA18_07915 [Dehalococcoidia bacterium]|jgi:hypothetical protein